MMNKEYYFEKEKQVIYDSGGLTYTAKCDNTSTSLKVGLAK